MMKLGIHSIVELVHYSNSHGINAWAEVDHAMPKFAFTASKYASDYVIAKVTLDCRAIVLKPQLGVFSYWVQAYKRAHVLNAAMGLTASESSQIITDVMLRPYAFTLEESSLASESLEIEASAPSCRQ